jgi:hypothetical protein
MMRALAGFFKKTFAALDHFFFSPVPLLPLAVFRIVFGLNLLLMYFIRVTDWRFYFTDDGFVPSTNSLEILPEYFRPAIALYPATPLAALAVNIVLLLAIAGFTLGYRARVMAIIAFIAHLSLMQRNYSIAYGADIVSTFFLFALCFMESDRYLSIRSFLSPKAQVSTPISNLFSTVGLRLLQLQLCVIYGFTGLEKLKGSSWWDGTAVWAVIGNRQIMMLDASWLKSVPLVIVAMTFTTVLWEVYFPALVWVKPIRKWVLLLGVLLHLGIALSVGLIFFSTAMISTYFVFVDPHWLHSILKLNREKF